MTWYLIGIVTGWLSWWMPPMVVSLYASHPRGDWLYRRIVGKNKEQ